MPALAFTFTLRLVTVSFATLATHLNSRIVLPTTYCTGLSTTMGSRNRFGPDVVSSGHAAIQLPGLNVRLSALTLTVRAD